MSKANNRNLQQYTLVQRSRLNRRIAAKNRSAERQSILGCDSWRLIRRGLFAAILSSTWISTADAQVNQKQPPAQTKQPPAPTKQPGSTARKMSEQEKKIERARSLYADAANAQNNGAYSVAIELWNKLIAEHPDQPLVSSARYFLGVCYQEQESPDYPKAITAFRKALEDSSLKEREESLNNLGWCLYQSGIADGKADQALLADASKTFAVLLEKYPDSSVADKAMFYAGESESRLGNLEKAISYYNQLVQSRALAQSPVRPDAMFALGFSYEEAKQPKLATETYEAFLAAYPKNAQGIDANIRLAELALQGNRAEQAVTLFAKVIQMPEFKGTTLADYVYYRYAFALAKTGQFAQSAQAYQKLSELFPKSQYAMNAALATGQTLMRDKKYDDALRSFERLLSAKDERAAEASHWICQIAILQNRPKDAVPVAREALDWTSKWDVKTLSPSAKNMIAMLKMDLADGLYATADGKAEARKLYEQIAVEYMDLPVSPRATYNAAFAALQAGDHAEAQRWSEAFAKRFANDDLASDVAYVRAESLLQLSQPEAAATAFEQLINSASNHPSVPAWELRLATALYLAGQFDKSIEQAAKTLNRNPDPSTRAEALFVQGASFLKLQKLPESIKALNDSVAANAAWAQADEVLLLLAQALDANQDKENAKKTLERLLKDFPNSRFRQQAEFRLGQLSAFAGRYQDAIVWFDKVLAQSTDPTLLDYVRYDKAFVLIQDNQFAPAIELLDTVLSVSKNANLIREAKIAKGICLRKTDKPQEAAALLSELLGTQIPEDSRSKVLYELGLSYAMSQQPKNAVEAFEKIVQSSPSYNLIDRVYFELAWAYKALGDTTKANENFLAITERFPDSPLAAESSFHVGQAEFENAKFDRAVKAYTVAATKTANAELQEKSLYKLGLSLFQQKEFAKASQQFAKQLDAFPKGELQVDARLMVAECSFKQEQFSAAWPQYETARRALESMSDSSGINDQVKSMIYLHGAQSARELKKWNDVDAWVARMQAVVPGSNLEPIGKYEQAFAKQNLKKNDEAVKLYLEVAEDQRNELGARSRFMIGEVYFADRNFAKAISEFQKVMYGYGGTQAPDDIKNWQARSAFEAGRCSEVVISDLSGERRRKAADNAKKFYQFIVENHPQHSLAKQAAEQIETLSK